MKKFLSMLLALVMVLTMAAFPAFAEGDSVLSILSVQSPFGDDGNAIKNAIDGNWGSHHRPAGTYPTNSEKGADGNWYFIVDFGLPYNVTSFRVKWSVNFTTQAVLYGSNDLSGEWTEIADLTFDAQETTTAISHTGEYRYVKVESYKLKANNPAVFEIEFTGINTTKLEADVIKYSTTTDADKSYTNITDGDATTIYSVNAWIKGDDGTGTNKDGYPKDWTSAANTVILDLGDLYTIDALDILWGKQGGAWGRTPANDYTVSVSADNVTYTPIKSYTGIFDIVNGGENTYNTADTTFTFAHPSWTGSYTENVIYSYGRVLETNLNEPDVRYVKIEITSATVNPTIAEVSVYKKYEDAEAVPATYTVNYVDENGNALAESKTVEDKMAGNKVTETAVTIENYKPDADKKSLVLVDGTNEITFVYYPRQSTTYTIEYVDFDGNPVAPAKTGNSYEDETITEVPETVAGYLCIDTVRTKSIVLSADAADNYITFTYNKVLTPTKAIRTQAPGTNNSGNDLTRLYDGKFNAYTQYTIPVSYDFSTRPVEYVYVYSALTDFDKVSVYTNYNRYTKAKIYTSLDGEEWTLALSTETIRDDQQVLSGFVTEANATTTVYLNEFVLPEGTQGTHLKLEIVETNVSDSQVTWCGIYEMAVEGTELVPADLSNATVVEQKSWGWQTGDMDSSVATLFDGEAATNNKGYYGHGYFDSKHPYTAGTYYIEVDLGKVFTDPTIAIQGGSSDWNYTHLLAYDVYVAGIDGKYGDTPVATVDKGALSDANKVRVDILPIDADEVRFVKIVANSMERRPVIGEISVFAEAIDLSANPEKAGVSLGASIRLPSDRYTAGLRFGATIMKDVIKAAGIDYDYTALTNAGVKIGMYMLPKNKLGEHATLADYLAVGVQEALDVPAKRLISEDDNSITFTAVLTEIPESAYATDIVAVPYICIGGTYTYYPEMTRSFKSVAETIADEYEAGDVELTEDEVAYLETLLGITLTAPEVE